MTFVVAKKRKAGWRDDRRLRARPPVGQQQQQVRDCDHAIAINVDRTAGIRTPGGQQRAQVGQIDDAVAVEIGGAFALVWDSATVRVSARVVGDIAEIQRAIVIAVSQAAEHIR